MRRSKSRFVCLFIVVLVLTAPVSMLKGNRPGGSVLATLTVDASLDANFYTWYGDVEVTASVTLSGAPVLGAVVTATCLIEPAEAASLLDDGAWPDAIADDGVYTGYFRIGGQNGTAKTAQSGNVLLVNAVNGGDSGSDTATFTTFAAERWSGFASAFPPVQDNDDTYTDFVPSPNGYGWHHLIEEFAVVSSRNNNGAMVRLPIFPKSNSVSNVTVTGSNIQGIDVKDNVIQFRTDLVSGTNRFDIGFDSPGDLAATHIDRYRTGHIGLRQFRNGYVVWNEHVSMGIFGSPNLAATHGVGCAAGMQVLDRDWNRMRSVDCMERVGIVFDGSLWNSGGSYPVNVKWIDQDGNSWLVAETPESLTFAVESTPTYCGGDLKVTRTMEFYSGKRYVRNNYTVENADSTSHTATLLWGREQWLYGDTTALQENDRGYVGGDPTQYGSGHRVDGAVLTDNYFGAVDIGSYYSLGIIFNNLSDARNRPTYVYFLYTPPIRFDGGTYPVDYSQTATDEGSTFFEKQFGSLAAGSVAHFEFYMWGGYNYTVDDVVDMVGADATEVAAPPGFDIQLQAGWNLVSVPLVQQDQSIDAVLSAVAGKWDSAMAYGSGAWISNSPSRPPALNDLTDLNRTMGLWLHATEDAALTVTGQEPATTAIPLYAGWNLVGYPSLTPMEISTAFAGTGYDRPVEGFDGASPYHLTQLADTYLMQPGEGYWIHVPVDTVWVVNW